MPKRLTTNRFGDNFSNMTISKPRDLDIKTNDGLYNDPNLAIVSKNFFGC